MLKQQQWPVGLEWNREVKMLKMTDEDGEVEKDMTHRGPYVP